MFATERGDWGGRGGGGAQQGKGENIWTHNVYVDMSLGLCSRWSSPLLPELIDQDRGSHGLGAADSLLRPGLWGLWGL